VQARIYFYAISFQSVNGNACGSFAASPIFYFFDYKIFETFYKIKLWALKTVAAAASSFIL
jgi:hypothetical protein